MPIRILEIGTDNGEATLAIATASADAHVISMEPDAAKAAVARRRFADAGLADRITVIIGEPARFLHKIRGPFDLIVQRTDDDSIRERLEGLLRPGGMLIRTHRKYSERDMTIAEWLAHAKADAEKRGLPELIPMLDGLAQATQRLRDGDWNDHPDKETPFDSIDAAGVNLAQDKPRDHDQ
jgi:predicted O-methyltransferase YrrM